MNLCFPTTIVDNFLPNPDIVREYASTLEFDFGDNNNFPGMRSKPLEEIAPRLHQQVVNSVMSVFYDLIPYNTDMNTLHHVNVNATSSFQLVSGTGKGWVHTDPCVCTSIIYLTPNLDSSFGTSIYDRKKAFYGNPNGENGERYTSFRENRIDEDIEKQKDGYNEGFEETISIKNKYNRMIVFDGHLAHTGHGEDIQTDEFDKARLTLVTFYNIVNTNYLPLTRARKMTYHY